MRNNTGMLWFDDDPKRPLEEKVLRAVTFYQAKLKETATVCHVHPALAEGKPAVVAGVKLVADRTIIKHHFWVGVE